MSLNFSREQLLVRGERHHGVADFVREAVGHGLDEAQVGGLDLQLLQLLGLREVVGGEQRGNRHGGIAALKRHDADAVNGAGRIFRLVAERPDGRAGFQHLINFCAERLRQVAEFQFAGALVFPAKMAARGLVGVQHLQVAPDDDAGAAQFAQHVGHHLVVAGELVVQPDVAEGEADLFEQVENQFQFDVHERLAGDAPVKHGHAGDGFAVGNGHGDLRAQQFKFLLRLDVGARLVAVAAQNASEPGKLAADAGVQRQFKMFEQAGGKADGGRGAEPAAVFRRQRLGERRDRAVEENGGAVDAQDFAEEQQELFQHRLGVQRMRQDGRKIAQHVERLRGVDEAGGVGGGSAARKNCVVFPDEDGCNGAGSAARGAGAFHRRSSNEFNSRPGRAWSAHG